MWSRSRTLGLSFGLDLCGLVLGLSLVFHSWHGKFKTYWLNDRRKYLLFCYLLSLKMQCIIYYSYCAVIFADNGQHHWSHYWSQISWSWSWSWTPALRSWSWSQTAWSWSLPWEFGLVYIAGNKPINRNTSIWCHMLQAHQRQCLL